MTRSTQACWLALVVAALALPAAAQKPSAPAPQAPVPETYLFQVVLLVADNEGGASIQSMPKNVRQAVDDIRDFLSFTRYQLVDTALIRTGDAAQGVLNGPDGEDLQINFQTAQGRVFGVGGGYRQIDSPRRLQVDGFTLFKPGKVLLRTSFSVDVGETIVVGTSRLDGGGKALVALFTAIP